MNIFWKIDPGAFMKRKIRPTRIKASQTITALRNSMFSKNRIINLKSLRNNSETTVNRQTQKPPDMGIKAMH
jgi:hypothetical protein